VPFTTALDALDRAGVTAKTRLLIIGAAGAVGSAAMAIAHCRGAKVIAAVRRDDPRQTLTAAGVTTLKLDGDVPLAELLSPYFPDGADCIFDTAGAWLPEAVTALAPFGRIAVIAAPADGHVRMPLLELYRRGGSVVGINSLLHDPVACAAILTRLAPDFETGRLTTQANLRVIPLSDGPEAYAALNRGEAAKIVLQCHPA